MPRLTLAEKLENAMVEAGQDVFGREVVRIVQAARADTPPTDPGRNRNPNPELPPLRDSYVIRRKVNRAKGHLYTINVVAPHAMKQHEELVFRHPRGGKAKYLERNVIASMNRFQAELAASVQKNMAGLRLQARADAAPVPDYHQAIDNMLNGIFLTD